MQLLSLCCEFWSANQRRKTSLLLLTASKFIIMTSYKDPLGNSKIHCGHLLFVLLEGELHKKRFNNINSKMKVWTICSMLNLSFSLQLVCACRGFVHTMTFLQQLEQLFHRDAGIWRTSQGEDLPKQHPERPAAHRNRQKCLTFFCTTKMFS